MRFLTMTFYALICRPRFDCRILANELKRALFLVRMLSVLIVVIGFSPEMNPERLSWLFSLWVLSTVGGSWQPSRGPPVSTRFARNQCQQSKKKLFYPSSRELLSCWTRILSSWNVYSPVYNQPCLQPALFTAMFTAMFTAPTFYPVIVTPIFSCPKFYPRNCSADF